MATLVLTAVGTALGGPIGGAIGALIGQRVDNELFQPKGREGPRLNDLKIQTSSYGTQIPQIFGTMRVSGTVIWATDLIEHRSRSGGGKGRPSTTTFQYSASFAVALSSRPIVAVRRIWADGNLLRGSDGVLKERGTLRVLSGSAVQDVDAAIGAGTSGASGIAHRGLAIAVFDDLDLSAFGNRIPQLSFEVEADAGPIDAAVVGNALIAPGRVAASALPVGGYAAQGDTASEAVAPLALVDGWTIADDPLGGGWSIAPRDDGGGGDVRRIEDFRSHAGAGRAKVPLRRARAPARETAGAVRLRYYDPARDYQTGQQTALVAGGGRREIAIDLPAVGAADAIAAQAGRVAARTAAARESVSVEGDFAALALPIGAVLTADDMLLAGLWRLSERSFRDGRIILGLTRYRGTWTGAAAGAPGTAVAPIAWPAATGFAVVVDLPPSGDQAATSDQFAIAIGGSNGGWRGADLWWRRHPDIAPVELGRVPPAAAVGQTETTLAAASPALYDDIHAVDVRLVDPDMTLVNASDAALAAGANRAMIGAEPMQFGRAAPLGGGLWRLSHLLRARQGTEDIAGPHPAGTSFVLIDTASLVAFGTAEGEAVRGGAIEWSPVGGDNIYVEPVGDAGRAVRALSPVHARTGRSGGSIRLSWTRRSRAGFGWRDYVDAPLGEAALMFEIALTAASLARQSHMATETFLVLDRAALAAFAGGADIAVSVRQVGDFAPSPPLDFAIAAALLG